MNTTGCLNKHGNSISSFQIILWFSNIVIPSEKAVICKIFVCYVYNLLFMFWLHTVVLSKTRKLKNLRFTTLASKVIAIRKSEFLAKNYFLKLWNYQKWFSNFVHFFSDVYLLGLTWQCRNEGRMSEKKKSGNFLKIILGRPSKQTNSLQDSQRWDIWFRHN